MKKTLLVCMLLIAIALSFAACGGKDNSPSNEGNINGTPHTHSFGEWEVTVKSTCTENGTKVRYCSCGEKQSEIVVALGHTPADATVENKVDPTYEADGSYNEVVRCATCNEKLSETPHVIPMLKHTPADAVEENRVESTCYSEGSYDTVVYCSDCGAELERTKHTIDKIAHTPANAVEENRINATYDKDGSYQMVVYCSVSVCKAELERTTHTLDMLVHHPGEIVVENEIKATCYSEGSYDEVIYCLDDDCGHKELSRKTVSLQKIAHSPANAIIENRVEATCTVNGSYDEVVYCSIVNCKVQISRTTKLVDAIGHKYVNGICNNCGDDITSKNLEFTLNADGKSYGVTGIGKCTDTNVIIPKSYNSLPVTSIGERAFESCSQITSIIIPDSITAIGNYAFKELNRLTDIKIPRSVAYIGEGVLAGCTSIESITIPFIGSNVKETYTKETHDFLHFGYIFGQEAYAGMVYTELYFMDTIGAIVHDIYYLPKRLKTATILGGNISPAAFMNCINISNIYFGDDVTGIDCEAFVGCNNLKYLEYNNGYYLGNSENPTLALIKVKSTDISEFALSDTTKVIAANAFNGCSKLASISIPESVISIGSNAFRGCDNLDSVYITDLEKWYNIQFACDRSFDYRLSGDFGYDYNSPYANPVYGNRLYLNNELVTSVTISDDVTAIGNAFIGCVNITNITIPSNVESIANYAFAYCTNLSSVVITEGLSKIGEGAFIGCINLVSITIPKTVTSMGECAFADCSSLANIEFNAIDMEGFDSFSDGPFCIESINVERTVSIGKYVTKVADRLFYNAQVSTVQFEEGSVCESIGDFAFYSNSYYKVLKKINIPYGVTSIGYSAFEYSDNLECILYGNAYYLGNETNPYMVLVKAKSTDISYVSIHSLTKFIYDSAFKNCTNLDQITIPDSVISIGSYAFKGCSSLESVTIGKSVTSIASGAFSGCTSLEMVYVNSLESWLMISFENGTANPLSSTDNTTLSLLSGKYIDGTVSIPNGTTTINSYAFYGYKKIRGIRIPDTLMIIGKDAFYNCDNLSAVYITDLSNWCNIDFDNSYSQPLYYGKNLYLNGELISELVIPNDVTTIGYYTFMNCTNLTSVIIHDSVTSIYSYFSGCTNLSSISVDENNAIYKSIDGVLYEINEDKKTLCLSIFPQGNLSETFIVPNNVTMLGVTCRDDHHSHSIWNPFSNCLNLKSIIITNSVTHIGNIGSNTLTDIYYTGTEEEWKNIYISSNHPYIENITIHYNYVL